MRFRDVQTRAATRLSPSAHDVQTAYQLVLECLPRASLWRGAVARRRDGTTAEGIFGVLDVVRAECLARIGDVADGLPLADTWPALPDNFSLDDQVAAYRLATESLPRPELWSTVVRLRCDGSAPEGVFSAIDQIRVSLHGHLDDLCTRRAELLPPSIMSA